MPNAAYACAGSNPAGITFSYDANGNLSSYCDSGGSLRYGYDQANRLTALAEPGGTVNGGACSVNPCISFQYDNADRRTTTTFPGGATMNVSYDLAGNQTSAIGKNSNQNFLTAYAYTYAQGSKDTALRQTMVQRDPAWTRSTTYNYDAQNRLTQAQNSGNN